MISFVIGRALILLIAIAATALGALSLRIAAAIDGHRPGRMAAELRPDATVPMARLDQGEENWFREVQIQEAQFREQRHVEPMQRLSALERDGLPRHTTMFPGLR